MSNNKRVGSRVDSIIFFALLIVIFGLASCGGKGGSKADPVATPATTYTITATSDNNGSITPTGTTTVTQGASQSYTITPNPGYALATLSIDGTAAAISLTHTFTNVQANHTINATFGAVLPGGIVMSLVPSRTTGVAPLSVFFDASGTTDAAVTSRPFHDLEYTWSFDDPGSGTWANGAQPGVISKNSATGPVAAHVFETPGTFTVTVSAYDGTNTATTTTTITVEDPDVVFAGANTICVSSSGDFAGCPTAAVHLTSANATTSVSTYALSNRRVLFRRGEAFDATAKVLINHDGPGTIGAYGAGARPIFNGSVTDTAIQLSSGATPTIKDWRIMDIEIDSHHVANQNDPANINIGLVSIKQVLLKNLYLHDAMGNVNADTAVLDYYNSHGSAGQELAEDVAIVDCTITPTIGEISHGGRFYGGIKRLTIQGNNIGSGSHIGYGSHTLRITYAGKGVIENNTIYPPATNWLSIKLHGPTWCWSGSPIGTCINIDNCGAYCATIASVYDHTTNIPPVGLSSSDPTTHDVVISDNVFYGASNPTYYGFTVALGPQNATSDERVTNIIVERNLSYSGMSTISTFVSTGYEHTYRNNICSGQGNCFDIRYDGGGANTPAPQPSEIRVLNNTIYSEKTAVVGVKVEQSVASISIINNLVRGLNDVNTVSISSSACSSCYTSSNNSTDAQARATSGFTEPPLTISDFKPLTGYTIGAGVSVPVWSDFFRTLRPQNGAIDIGAVEVP